MQSKQKSKLVWGKLQKLFVDNEIYVPLNNPQMYLFERENQDGIKITKNISYRVENQDNAIQQPRNINQINDINNQEVDNTGNLFWPAEEVLAYFCVNNTKLFHNMSTVIELGSGKSGLAAISLMLVSCSENGIKNVIITDGNISAVQQLNQNITLNQNIFSEKGIKVEINISFEGPNCFRSSQQLCLKTGVLQWKKAFAQENMFEGGIAIIISDCVFFKNFHAELLATISFLLNNGQNYQQNFCLIACPNRGGSLERFEILALKNDMTVERIEFNNIIYKQEVDKLKLSKEYEEDRHKIYFVKVQLK